MGLFYTACLAADWDQHQLEKSVIGAMPNVRMTDNSNGFLSASCDYFIMSFFGKKNSVEVKNEIYNMRFSHELWLDIYDRSNPDDWERELYRFIGRLLHLFSGDFILEYNGDTCVLMRKDGVVTVKDTWYSEETKPIYDALGMPYMVGPLPHS